ncbi:MAG: HAD-IA family hydrolase [Betaproteobacteria bacterium]|nr:HAD-IA family hydrolase [Betaproteobacteria bacterium]
MAPRSVAALTLLPRIRAITLDLDDTLWPATPTFVRAEQRAHAWLQVHAPAVAAMWSINELRALRMSIYEAQPQLRHDFLRMRRLALTTAFEQANLSGAHAQALIEQALHVYMSARNEVDLYPEVRASLARLKRRYALASLTNGNADVARIGLGEFFSATISAHVHGVSKPEAALFHLACRSLDCAPEQVVHVGDDAELDVRGARAAGLRCVWMNRAAGAWTGADAPVAVKDLLELEQWLDRQDA